MPGVRIPDRGEGEYGPEREEAGAGGWQAESQRGIFSQINLPNQGETGQIDGSLEQLFQINPGGEPGFYRKD